MKSKWTAMLLLAAGALTGACSDPAGAQAPVDAGDAGAAVEGRPYELSGTQVWTVPDPVSGRDYEVFVSLPASYDEDRTRRYPTLYITDADYGFPLIRSIARRVNLEGPAVEEFILIGLSYAVGEGGAASRARDYTPTPNGPRRNRHLVHGGAEAYRLYIRDHAIPFVENRLRADPGRRVYMGHSYGGLLGAQIMFTQPEMFDAYILGSPSLWYDDRHMLKLEAQYARTHRDLPANVFMYIGVFEGTNPGDARFNRTLDMVGDMATFERQLRSREYPGLTVASDVVDEENHLTVFPSGLTRGLMKILPADGAD